MNEMDLIFWIQYGLAVAVLPLGVGGWKWARRIERRVLDNAEKFAVIDEKLTHIMETLEKHDEHLEEVRQKVASELGVNGVGVRERSVRTETQLLDHLRNHS